MTNVDFRNKFANKAGISQKAASEYLKALEDTIVESLVAGDEFKVADVNFAVKDVPAHEGRNPSTGETIHVEASKRVVVKAASTLKRAVNGTED